MNRQKSSADHLLQLLATDMNARIAGPSLLSNTTGLITYNHEKSIVSLSENGVLVIQPYGSGQDGFVIIDLIQTVIGVKHNIINEDHKICHYLDIYSYGFSKKTCIQSANKLRKRKVYQLNFQSNEAESSNWLNTMNTFIAKVVNPTATITNPKSYLILVNPVSGKGQGVRIWKETVQTMLCEAGISFNLVITTHANHAREYMLYFNPEEYQTIICIGGDGIMFEIVNGIANRHQGDGQSILKSLPIAPIPAGSGNGLVKSILHECSHDYSVINATFLAIKGIAKAYDITDYETDSHQHYYSFLQFSYGLVADVDIHTEFLRPLGELRFTLGAIYYSLFKRKYRGKLSLYTGKKKSNTNTISNTNNNGNTLPIGGNNMNNHLHNPDGHNTTNNNSANSANANDPTAVVDDFIMPSLETPIANDGMNGWEIIQTEFNLIWILSTSHASSTVYSSPTSRLDDGVLTVLYCDDCSTIDLLQLLIAAENGTHIHHPKVKKLTVTAFRFEPYDLHDNGLFSLDGELIEYGPCQAHIKSSAASILTLPLPSLNYSPLQSNCSSPKHTTNNILKVVNNDPNSEKNV